MIGIKLLDKIHGFWNQLWQVEDQKAEYQLVKAGHLDEYIKVHENSNQLKIKIEACWDIVDRYHNGEDVKEEISYEDLPKIGDWKCPYCGAERKDMSQYRCGKPVVRCKCGKNLEYKTIYWKYERKEKESKAHE